jgi:ATP-binding protein involved in chromosome partitioning
MIWRGPILHGTIKQFLEDVNWGELDYLVVDLPPGTGDVQLSLTQLTRVSGGVIVTTPQEVALIDAERAADMFKKVQVPVLGVLENMSAFICPPLRQAHPHLRGGGRKAACREAQDPLPGRGSPHPFPSGKAGTKGSPSWPPTPRASRPRPS